GSSCSSGLLSRMWYLNDTAPPRFCSLSLPDALPIYARLSISREGRARAVAGLHDLHSHAELCQFERQGRGEGFDGGFARRVDGEDRKSTRLNSSHVKISYAVFCLKKNRHDTEHDCRR